MINVGKSKVQLTPATPAPEAAKASSRASKVSWQDGIDASKVTSPESSAPKEPPRSEGKLGAWLKRNKSNLLHVAGGASSIAVGAAMLTVPEATIGAWAALAIPLWLIGGWGVIMGSIKAFRPNSIE